MYIYIYIYIYPYIYIYMGQKQKVKPGPTFTSKHYNANHQKTGLAGLTWIYLLDFVMFLTVTEDNMITTMMCLETSERCSSI